MTIDTYLGEDERPVRVDFDYQAEQKQTWNDPWYPAQVILNEVYCIKHFEETGLKADELGLLSDEDEHRILDLCWEDVRQRLRDIIESKWSRA